MTGSHKPWIVDCGVLQVIARRQLTHLESILNMRMLEGLLDY